MAVYVVKDDIYKRYIENLCPKFTTEKINTETNKLNILRNQIDVINQDIWKKVRWYINPFDFTVKYPIINRAFYKYWEIVNNTNLFDEFHQDDIVLHCAEAPGGFIQGTNMILQQLVTVPEKRKPEVDEEGFTTISKRKERRSKHNIFTISLNKDLPQYKSYNLPSYNHEIQTRNLCITYGKDNTGDINNWENIHHITKLTKGKKVYLITGDGGFDEGNDFNHKEQLHYNLIFSEMYAAILHQQQGGHFILKIFDIFTETSLDFLFLLKLCYESIIICKPLTSRPTNSEKYIVCKNFNLTDEQRSIVLNKLEDFKNHQELKEKGELRLFDNVPETFSAKINEINDNMLSRQCEYLERAIKLSYQENFLNVYNESVNNMLISRQEIYKDWRNTLSTYKM